MRIAAVGDLHCRADTRAAIASALSGVDGEADCLLLAGDLTDHGTPEEASWLAEELGKLKLPRIGVFGNHDYEAGPETGVRQKLGGAGGKNPDGGAFAAGGGVGVRRVQGFAGGVGPRQVDALCGAGVE